MLTSAYKSAGWDKRKGRPETGPHTLGKAVDIRRHALQNRFKIVSALLQVSFKRISIAESFTHAILPLYISKHDLVILKTTEPKKKGSVALSSLQINKIIVFSGIKI